MSHTQNPISHQLAIPLLLLIQASSVPYRLKSKINLSGQLFVHDLTYLTIPMQFEWNSAMSIDSHQKHPLLQILQGLQAFF